MRVGCALLQTLRDLRVPGGVALGHGPPASTDPSVPPRFDLAVRRRQLSLCRPVDSAPWEGSMLSMWTSS